MQANGSTCSESGFLEFRLQAERQDAVHGKGQRPVVFNQQQRVRVVLAQHNLQVQLFVGAVFANDLRACRARGAGHGLACQFAMVFDTRGLFVQQACAGEEMIDGKRHSLGANRVVGGQAGLMSQIH